MKRSIAAATLFLLWQVRTVLAGGYEIGDTGGEAMGRGGAFVAKSDNPAAINYNPAGFAKLRGYQGAVSLNVVNFDYAFQRNSKADASSYPMISKTNPWFIAPLHLMVTADFGLIDGLTLGAGYYAPPTIPNSFPKDSLNGGLTEPSPTRYDLVSQTGIVAYPSFVVGYQLNDWIDVGVSFQDVIMQMKTSTTGTVGIGCTSPEDPACDVNINIEGSDLFAPSGSLGVLMRPFEWLELGASLRLPAKSEMKGKTKLEFGPGIERISAELGAAIVEPDVPTATVSKDFPWSLRLGARYVAHKHRREWFDLEADFTYDMWSKASKTVITMDGKVLGNALEPVVLDLHLKDTMGLRFGGSYNMPLSEGLLLTLRAGGWGESESASIENTRLHVPGPKRVGLTAGAGIQWNGWHFDLAYQHIFFPDRNVNNSSVTAMDFAAGAGPVIGNGAYKARYDAIILQVGFAFGLPSKEPRYIAENDTSDEQEPAKKAEEEEQTEEKEDTRLAHNDAAKPWFLKAPAAQAEPREERLPPSPPNVPPQAAPRPAPNVRTDATENWNQSFERNWKENQPEDEGDDEEESIAPRKVRGKGKCVKRDDDGRCIKKAKRFAKLVRGKKVKKGKCIKRSPSGKCLKRVRARTASTDQNESDS